MQYENRQAPKQQNFRSVTSMLRQIHERHPSIAPNTVIILRYAETDALNKFPDAFSSYGFTPAIRLLYNDPTLEGLISQESESRPNLEKAAEIRFVYSIKDNTPKIEKQ